MRNILLIMLIVVVLTGCGETTETPTISNGDTVVEISEQTNETVNNKAEENILKQGDTATGVIEKRFMESDDMVGGIDSEYYVLVFDEQVTLELFDIEQGSEYMVENCDEIAIFTPEMGNTGRLDLEPYVGSRVSCVLYASESFTRMGIIAEASNLNVVEKDVGSSNAFVPDYMPGEQNLYGISNANISAGGYLDSCMMTEQGEYIYFIFRNCIYKYKEGEQPIEIVTSDEYLHGINICGDYIYYTEGNYELSISDSGKIKRIRTDGTNAETLVEGVVADEIFVVNNEMENVIYYIGITYNNSSNPSLCLEKYNMTTNNCEKLVSSNAHKLMIIGLNQDTKKLFMGEKYERNNETFWNIGCYDILGYQYEQFFEEPDGRIGDIFLSRDDLIVDEFGWIQYIGMIETSGKNTEFEQSLDPNFRGVILVDDENIVIRQSMDIWLVNIESMRNAIDVNNNHFKLSEIEGAIKLVGNDNAKKCGIAKGWFYYMPDEDIICRVKLDGSNWEFFMQ